MKLKTLLLSLLLFITLIQPVNAEEDMYDLGHELATCSGDFSQMGSMFEILKQDADAKVVKQKSNGWMVAAVVSFITDEMKPEIAWSSAEGIRDTTVAQWEARLGTTNEQLFIKNFNSDNDKEFNESFEGLMNKIKGCTFYGELVELSIKIYRKSIK
jgi:hypothetical protein